MVFDSGTDADNHALERLRTDVIGWLTTVTPDGQPQTFPIWFLWVDGEVLVYSDRRAKRLRNIGANPRVALHLNDDGTRERHRHRGGRGADRRVDAARHPRTPAYLAKYGDWIREQLNSAEEMETIYNVPGLDPADARPGLRGVTRRRTKVAVAAGAAAAAGLALAGPVLDRARRAGRTTPEPGHPAAAAARVRAGAGAPRDAARRRPPRRLAAVRARPARARRPRPPRRAADDRGRRRAPGACRPRSSRRAT